MEERGLLRQAAGGDEAGLVGEHDGLDAVAQAELAEHVCDVGLDGGVRCIVAGISPTVLRTGCYAVTGSAGPCAISDRTRERKRLPVMSAPTAKIAAAHQNAVV